MSRKHKLISFLLDNDVPESDRMQIAYEIKHRFPCSNHYAIVPHILDTLEDGHDVPSIEYYVDNFDYTYFTDTVDDAITVGDAFDHMKQDYKRLLKNQLLGRIQSYIEKPEEEIDVNDMMVQLRQVIDKFDERMDIQELETLLEYYEERENKKPGLHSYIEPVDQYVNNFELGTVSTLAGKSGQFKTTIALWMMYNNILNGKNMVFLTLEMSRELIMYLLASRHSYHEKFHDDLDPIPTQRIRDGELDPVDKKMLMDEVWADMRDNGQYGDFEILAHEHFNGFTKTAIRSRLARLDFEVDGVIVDYIQTLKYEDHPFDNISSDPINYYVRAFSQLTDDVDGSGKESHVVLLSQVNKAGYRRARENQGFYDKDAVSEANMIERESTQMWFTFAPKELKNMGQSKITLAKNRYGPEHSEAHLIDLEAGVLYADSDGEQSQNMNDVGLDQIVDGDDIPV